ncbi:hypothetical protein F0T03_18015 [Yersinia canariae]|uniref:Uncharacterized protein n=1 Tax=Yersinia canariae TaxID=2607663 RepID=A0A857F2Z7_9GAMM|nr:hypothetical protein [Yersinia canariae]QHB33868.1 hypothetical protein F0T03_18015 [Yersinia canariae]
MLISPTTNHNTTVSSNRSSFSSEPSINTQNSVANSIRGISSGDQQSYPLSSAEKLNNNVFSFSQSSANGQLLGDINKASHATIFLEHLKSQNSNTQGFNKFIKATGQDSSRDLKNTTVKCGAKVTLTLFSLLPDDKKDVKLAKSAQSFYHSMVKFSEQPDLRANKDSTYKVVMDFVSAIFNKMELSNHTEQTGRLDKFCSEYLKQYVYPDIILKLEGKVSDESLQKLRDDPTAVEGYLYTDQKKSNDEMINSLKQQFFGFKRAGDKAVKMNSLISELEHKTQLIADLNPQLKTPSRQASQPEVSARLADSPPPDYDMGPPSAASAGRANSSPGDIINSFIFITGNDTKLDEQLNRLTGTLTSLVNDLKEVKSLPERVAPGGSLQSTPNYITTATLYLSGTDAVVEPQSTPAAQIPIEAADLSGQTFTNFDDSSLLSPKLVQQALRVMQDKKVQSQPLVSQKEDSPVRHLSSQGNAFMGLAGDAAKTPALQKYSEVPQVTLTRGGQTSNLSRLQTYRLNDSYQLTPKNTTSSESEMGVEKNIQEQDTVSVKQPKRPFSLNAQGNQFVGLRGNAAGFAPLQQYSDTSVTLTRGGQVRDLNRKLDYKMSDTHQVSSKSLPADKQPMNPPETN